MCGWETQCGVVRLPRWPKAEAELIIFVVISGYVRVFACARILMAAIESECMTVSSSLVPPAMRGQCVSVKFC